MLKSRVQYNQDTNKYEIVLQDPETESYTALVLSPEETDNLYQSLMKVYHNG